MSAGLNQRAETLVSAEMVAWADAIFVMEPAHKKKLGQRFGHLLKGKRVFVLGIKDQYDYMQEELVHLLEAKVAKCLNI